MLSTTLKPQVIGRRRNNNPPNHQEAHRRWKSVAALKFICTVSCVKIRKTRTDGAGTVLYVVEVHPSEPDSSLAQGDDSTASPSYRPNPPLVVQRRFSDFEELREGVLRAVSILPQCTCQYCVDFAVYIRLKLCQPRTIAKLIAGPEKRKKILNQFMNDMLTMGKRRVQKTGKRRCEAQTLVPILLKDFLLESE